MGSRFIPVLCGGGGYRSVTNITYNFPQPQQISGFGALLMGVGCGIGGWLNGGGGGGWMNSAWMNGGGMPWSWNAGGGGGHYNNSTCSCNCSHSNSTNTSNNNDTPSSTTSTTGSVDTPEFDADAEAIKSLERQLSKVDNYKNPTKQILSNLYETINDRMEHLEDDVNTDANKESCRELLNRIKNIWEEHYPNDNMEDYDPTNDLGNTQSVNGGGGTPNSVNAVNGGDGGAGDVTLQEGSEPEQGNGTGKVDLDNKYKTADDLPGLKMSEDDYAKLNDAGKDAYKKKAIELAKQSPKRGKALNDELKNNLPAEVRRAVKEALQKEANLSYSNATEADLTEANLKKLKSAIDTKPITTIAFASTGTSAVKNGDTWTVTVKNKNNVSTTVKYKQIESEDGELLFQSNKNKQIYVLQKDGNGNFYFVQYKYHEGFGSPDLTNANKNQDN